MMSPRIVAWWYISIGAGFIALGVRAAMFAVPVWLVALRFAIAFAFLTLGILSFRRK